MIELDSLLIGSYTRRQGTSRQDLRSNKLKQPPGSVDSVRVGAVDLVQIANHSQRPLYTGMTDMIANYSGWSAAQKASYGAYFRTIPDPSSTKVLDQIKTMTMNGGKPGSFAGFSDQEKKLFGMFLGQSLRPLYKEQTGRGRAVSISAMDAKVSAYFQAPATNVPSNVGLGDCTTYHTYLAHAMARTGLKVYTTSVNSGSGHLIVALQDSAKYVAFLDYGTLYQTTSKDIEKAMSNYESKNVLFPFGQRLFAENEKIIGVIYTPSTQRFMDAIGYQRPLDALSSERSAILMFGGAIGNYQEGVQFNSKFFTLGANRIEGRYSDVYESITTGSVRAAIPMPWSGPKDKKNTLLFPAGLNLGLIPYQVRFKENGNSSEGMVMNAGIRQHVLYHTPSWTFSAGALIDTNIVSEGNSIDGSPDAFRYYNYAYGILGAARYHINGSIKNIYLQSGVQGIYDMADAQESRDALFNTDIIVRGGAVIDGPGGEIEAAVQYDRNSLNDIYKARGSYQHNDLRVSASYEHRIPRYSILEQKYGAHLKVEKTFGDAKDITGMIMVGKGIYDDILEVNIGCTKRFGEKAGSEK